MIFIVSLSLCIFEWLFLIQSLRWPIFGRSQSRTNGDQRFSKTESFGGIDGENVKL